MQEKFISEGKPGKVYFNNERFFPGLHQRYMMMHVESRGKVSSGQIWDFVQPIKPTDLNRIKHYKNNQKLSRRMLTMTKKMYNNFPPHATRHTRSVSFMHKYNIVKHYSVCFPFTEQLHRSPNQIARELEKLVTLHQLNTVTYAQTVNQKKQVARAAKHKAAANPVSAEDKLLSDQLIHKKKQQIT